MISSFFFFLLIFSFVVLVHELGHFLAARKAGVPVYEFSIGFAFSPKILTFFRYRETKFTLRLLPLGGFVSFSAEGDEDAAKLFRASALSRAAIMAGGPVFNLLFSFLLFIPAFMLKSGLSFPSAVSETVGTIGMVIAGTAALFTGQADLSSLSGPVGIAVMAGKAAAAGWINLLFFSGFLSLSLGIMNLLPVPGLDGGQLVTLFIETVRKKPFSAGCHRIINLTGILLFVLLSMFVTWQDVVRLSC